MSQLNIKDILQSPKAPLDYLDGESTFYLLGKASQPASATVVNMMFLKFASQTGNNLLGTGPLDCVFQVTPKGTTLQVRS